MIQATVLVITAMFILSNVAADLVQSVLDPRHRRG
jgi:ABC-type dipeptide/oligopeptide/nickel transport system permease component